MIYRILTVSFFFLIKLVHYSIVLAKDTRLSLPFSYIPRAGNNGRSPINDRQEKACDRRKMLLADHRDR